MPNLSSAVFTGSMCGKGPDAFAVLLFAITHADREGNVELHPSYLAGLLGTKREAVEAAVEVLCEQEPPYRIKPIAGVRRFQYRFTDYD